MKWIRPLYLLCCVAPASLFAEIDFAREILPILSDKCFLCHGPDTKKEKDLRLDSREGATRDRGGYKAIDPEDLTKSEILKRIHDHEDPMPPTDAETQLSESERALIDRWVREGGTYAQHWAFVPPKKSAGAKNIDDFITARLSKAKAHPAPATDPETLARRAALTLTGLPPEPEQLKRFLATKDYSALIEELLASERFGEHQARYWLDAVRYGDTHGLHLDNRRAIYPYRDWVVRAFNQNKPFNEFIIEQLAGDLLPNPTLDQRIATGFVRMNPSTAEGGAIKEEFQAKNNFDRTENLGTVLLGMTLNCARCHTHKYDPIQQTEYYQLMAFFNSTSESPMDGNAYVYEPVLHVPPDQPAWNAWQDIATARDRTLAQAKLHQSPLLADAITFASSAAEVKTSNWKATGNLKVDVAPTDKNWKEIKGLPGTNKRERMSPIDQARWLQFELEASIKQNQWLSFSSGDRTQVWLNDNEVAITDSGSNIQTAQLSLPAGKSTVRLKMTGVSDGSKVSVYFTSPWRALAKQKNWETLPADDQLLALADPCGPFAQHPQHKEAQPLAQRLAQAKAAFVITLVAKELPSPRPTKVLMRGEYHLPMGDALQPGVFAVMGGLQPDAPVNRLGLAQWLTSRNNPLVARVLINRIWQRTFGQGLVRTPEDFGLQGEQPTHPDLLDWLAVEFQDSGWDMKHVIRLMVNSQTFKQDSRFRTDVDDPENRLWARGPSYRLDAEVIRDIGLWASNILDPHMGGEGVKPAQPGGMWSALMHPASNTKNYLADTGKKQYRRSLYVYWKRTSPHPMMTLFNAPDRESSCVKRDRASTPLQSLGLLNETQRIDMATSLAQRLLQTDSSDDKRIDHLFTLLACRPANKAEREACTQLLASMRTRYTQSEEDAAALLANATPHPSATVTPSEHAAWTQVAITVLASDLALLLY